MTVTVGRLCGIRIDVHVSWLVVFALLTAVLARNIDATGVAAVVLGATCALALFAGVVGHELAHALAARRFGVQTDAITLFLLGGVASLSEEPPTARADVAIALAGPAASAVAAIAAFGLLLAAEHWLAPLPRATVSRLLAYVALVNGFLAAFNLLPAYPMDGGRVLRALLWRRGCAWARATAIASRVGMAFAVAFVAGAVLVVAATRNPAFAWYAVLGAYLLREARSKPLASPVSLGLSNEAQPALP